MYLPRFARSNELKSGEITMANETATIILNEYTAYFRDDDAFHQFVERFTEDLDHDMRPIVVDGRIIGATLSAAGAKEFLGERLEQRIIEDPSILDRLKKRMENDEIVD